MDFLELAKNRFSLRKFSDKKVEKEKIDYILAAMQAAPTAVNFQPQRILVLTDEKELEKVSKCTKRDRMNLLHLAVQSGELDVVQYLLIRLGTSYLKVFFISFIQFNSNNKKKRKEKN